MIRATSMNVISMAEVAEGCRGIEDAEGAVLGFWRDDCGGRLVHKARTGVIIIIVIIIRIIIVIVIL